MSGPQSTTLHHHLDPTTSTTSTPTTPNRIKHAYVRYNPDGTIATCAVCKITVTPATWERHINGSMHNTALKQLQDRVSAQQKGQMGTVNAGLSPSPNSPKRSVVHQHNHQTTIGGAQTQHHDSKPPTTSTVTKTASTTGGSSLGLDDYSDDDDDDATPTITAQNQHTQRPTAASTETTTPFSGELDIDSIVVPDDWTGDPDEYIEEYIARYHVGQETLKNIKSTIVNNFSVVCTTTTSSTPSTPSSSTAMTEEPSIPVSYQSTSSTHSTQTTTTVTTTHPHPPHSNDFLIPYGYGETPSPARIKVLQEAYAAIINEFNIRTFVDSRNVVHFTEFYDDDKDTWRVSRGASAPSFVRHRTTSPNSLDDDSLHRNDPSYAGLTVCTDIHLASAAAGYVLDVLSSNPTTTGAAATGATNDTTTTTHSSSSSSVDPLRHNHPTSNSVQQPTHHTHSTASSSDQKHKNSTDPLTSSTTSSDHPIAIDHATVNYTLHNDFYATAYSPTLQTTVHIAKSSSRSSSGSSSPQDLPLLPLEAGFSVDYYHHFNGGTATSTILSAMRQKRKANSQLVEQHGSSSTQSSPMDDDDGNISPLPVPSTLSGGGLDIDTTPSRGAHTTKRGRYGGNHGRTGDDAVVQLQSHHEEHSTATLIVPQLVNASSLTSVSSNDSDSAQSDDAIDLSELHGWGQ